MNELLHLKWISHNSKIVHNFQQLHEKQLFCDATIVCDGKYFPVHRLVLSSCSQYFEQIFEETPCKHPFIVLKDVEVEIFRDVVEFMYKGEVKILHNRLPTFISTANSLKVQGISSSDQLKATKSTESGISNIEHLNEESDIERERIVTVNVPKVSKKSTSESSLPSHTNTHHLKKTGERKRELVCSSVKPEKKIRLSQKADNEVCNDTSDTNYNDTNETNDGGNDIEDTEKTENDDDEDYLAIVKTEEFQDEEIDISFPDITKLENESDLTSLPSCSKSSISLDGVGSPTNNEDTKERSSEATSCSGACMNGRTTSLTANSGKNAGRDQASDTGTSASGDIRGTFQDATIVEKPQSKSTLIELSPLGMKKQKFQKNKHEFVETIPTITELKFEIRELSHHIKELCYKVHSQDQDSDELSDLVKMLPLTSKAEFLKFNRLLYDDKKKYDLMKNFFRALGGTDFASCCRNCLEKSIAHQLAINMTWTGKSKKKVSEEKIRLHGTILMDCINASIRMSYKATVDEIRHISMKWLHNANDRQGGRIRRGLKKISTNNKESVP